MRLKRTLIGLAVFLCALVAGLVAGLLTALLLRALGLEEKLASLIGTGVWVSAFVAILSYGTLYFMILPKPLRYTGLHRGSGLAQVSATTLQFAMIGGTFARILDPTDISTLLGILGWGAVGYAIGCDLRRRVRGLSELKG